MAVSVAVAVVVDVMVVVVVVFTTPQLPPHHHTTITATSTHWVRSRMYHTPCRTPDVWPTYGRMAVIWPFALILLAKKEGRPTFS